MNILTTLKQAREALQNIAGCFDAAAYEGLSDRLDEQPAGEVGSLRDLVERRLGPAFSIACESIASLTAIESIEKAEPVGIVRTTAGRTWLQFTDSVPDGTPLFAHPAPQPEWRDIVSAPKDGTDHD